MSERLEIQIPEPCSKSWENLKEEEGGRNCSSCNHLVRDFTEMSNEEIAVAMANLSSSRVCARMLSSQLREEPRLRTVWYKKLAAACLPFLLLIGSETSFAQEPAFSAENDSSSLHIQTDSIWVNGIVLDSESGEALPFANVIVEGGTRGASTDFNGKFSLLLAKNEFSKNLVISYVGFESRVVYPDIDGEMAIEMQYYDMDYETLGIVCTGPKRSFLRRWFNRLFR